MSSRIEPPPGTLTSMEPLEDMLAAIIREHTARSPRNPTRCRCGYLGDLPAHVAAIQATEVRLRADRLADRPDPT